MRMIGSRFGRMGSGITFRSGVSTSFFFYLRSAAFAPALLAWDRRAQAPAAPLLRCRLSTFSFTFTAIVWRCPGLSLLCRLAIRPPHALPSRGALCQGFGSRRGQPRLSLISTLSRTFSSHLLPFFTSLWPAAFRVSLALTPAGRYPLRHILFGLARRLPKIQGKASSPRLPVFYSFFLPSAGRPLSLRA